MATSGTYAFFPPTGELVVAAFRRIQIGRPELTSAHLSDAFVELNLMQAEWSNPGPLLWTVTLETAILTQGQTTVTAPTQTVTLLDAYISIPNGDGTSTDRILTQFSRTEWASQPEKLSQGSPTSIWFNRQTPSPQIWLWPVPDAGGPYTLNYYVYTQIQDSFLSGAQRAQVPYRWLDAYVAGLAYRLARIYKPALEVLRGADSQKAFLLASTQDTEAAPLAIQPQLDNYWR